MNRFRWLPALGAAVLSSSVLAQAILREPARSMSSVSSAYRSAFADYRRYEDVQVGDWRAINDAVRDAAASAGQRPAAPQGGPMQPPMPTPLPVQKPGPMQKRGDAR